ncbi:MAG TPA: helix-turn-helix domain-containing protein [Solirubrobacteraceae bacterium]|nr:helix-turn-helix domain-containing protein [Solirubrobacteraceae bacterium]
MATYAKGRERRAEILRVAREVFATRGFRSASLAVIAERAGLSEPGLLHHFPSKDHLLTAVLEERDDSEIERTRRQVEEEHRSRAEALIDLCRRNATRPEMVQLFTVLAAESVDAAHPAHEWFVERYRMIRALLVDGLEQEQREGRLAPDANLEQLAIEIVAMFDGLQLQWLLDRERVDMVAPFERFIARALPGPPPPRR